MESRLDKLHTFLKKETNMTTIPQWAESIYFEYLQLQEQVTYLQIAKKIRQKMGCSIKNPDTIEQLEAQLAA